MNNILDSRAIGRTDCYAQRFMRAGRFAYNILPAGATAISDARPFTIIVKEGDLGKMKQHNMFIKTKGGRFIPATEEMTINIGDLVLWNCLDAGALPFAVVGDQEFFDSARLTNECGFSHAFGSPGEYRWKDAYGSGLSGVITVTDPQCKCDADIKKWRKSLQQGTIVMITDKKAVPDKVEIVTGQTVFFAVVKSPGVSITDERFLGATGHC